MSNFLLKQIVCFYLGEESFLASQQVLQTLDKDGDEMTLHQSPTFDSVTSGAVTRIGDVIMERCRCVDVVVCLNIVRRDMSVF